MPWSAGSRRSAVWTPFSLYSEGCSSTTQFQERPGQTRAGVASHGELGMWAGSASCPRPVSLRSDLPVMVEGAMGALNSRKSLSRLPCLALETSSARAPSTLAARAYAGQARQDGSKSASAVRHPDRHRASLGWSPVSPARSSSPGWREVRPRLERTTTVVVGGDHRKRSYVGTDECQACLGVGHQLPHPCAAWPPRQSRRGSEENAARRHVDATNAPTTQGICARKGLERSELTVHLH
jgi:hypothetical protein